ncbi:ubiquitin-conjugating enzyme E2 Q2-like [Halichondria panicea]|uniref:ubiquitin-conjugating enzyme E2 Q2-like n=1 Tax=Halichondria panicea TaxID=6063 RepID=UPI00312B3588
MSRQKLLRTELSILEKCFPKNCDGCFQIVVSSVEELVCRFTNSKNGTSTIYDLTCNISPSYPVVMPIWISDSEDKYIADLVGELNMSEAAGSSHPLLSKVRYFISQMCEHMIVSLPPQVEQLFSMAAQQGQDSDSDNMEEDIGSDETLSDGDDVADGTDDDGDIGEDMFADEDLDLQADDQPDIGGDIGIAEENKAILERVRMNTRQEYLGGATSGSIAATDRLMRELKDIYRSQNLKDNIFSVELIDDCLYNWNMKLYKVDPDSPLFEDMKKLRSAEGKDHLLFHIVFDDKFPYSPPFVRLVKPVVTGGYVLAGGAICMELLTPQGWSSAYTVEAVIMQIQATLVKGKARIVFNQARGEAYTLSKAQHAYKSLVKIHEKSGWFTPPKDEG